MKILTLGFVGLLCAASGCASGEHADDAEGGSPSTGGWSGAGGNTGGGGLAVGGNGTGGNGVGGNGVGGSGGNGQGGGSAGGSSAGGSSAGGGGQGGVNAGGGGQGGQGGDTTAPTIVGTTPADASLAISAATPIDVTFSEPMNVASITTDTTSTCSGSIQISADGFTTCVAMTGPASTVDDTTFTLTPAAALDSARTYRVRVTTAAEDAAQNALSAAYTSPTGFTTRYAHTILIDGTNDFEAAETIASSTAGATLYFSYDDTHLYVGIASPAIVVGGTGDKFVHFFFSADPTLMSGSNISEDNKAQFGPTAQLTHHWKVRIDGGDYEEFNRDSGAGWVTNDWGSQGKTGIKVNGYFEGSVALSELGNPTSIVVATYTIDYEGDGGNGWLFNMLSGAVDGTGATPRSIYGYGLVSLPTSNVPNDLNHLITF